MKTLGQVLYELRDGKNYSEWVFMGRDEQSGYEVAAQSLVDEYERRKEPDSALDVAQFQIAAKDEV